MIYLSDTFFEHPKVVAAGGDAVLVYLEGLAWLKRQRSTDGLIPKAIVPRLSDRKAPHRQAARLVAVGLWHDRGEHYELHDYTEHNAKAIRTSEARRAAAEKRWRPDADAVQEPCKPHATKRRVQSNADANADAKASGLHMPQSTVHIPQSTSHSPPGEVERGVVGESHAPEEDLSPPEAPSDAEDPARRLASLAWDQPVKPTIRAGGKGSPFMAVVALLRASLDAGTPPEALERAIRAGVEVWTTAGLATAVARTRPRNGRSGDHQRSVLATARRLAQELDG